MKTFIVRYTSKTSSLVLQFAQRANCSEDALQGDNPWGLNPDNYYVSVLEL